MSRGKARKDDRVKSITVPVTRDMLNRLSEGETVGATVDNARVHLAPTYAVDGPVETAAPPAVETERATARETFSSELNPGGSNEGE